jgi:hypothetical protein
VKDGITTAQLVRGSAGADVPDIALIGFAAKDSGPQRGSLCAFPIRGDYDQPLWIARITNADIRTTPFSADYKEAEFSIGCARALDIFPDRPGTEIVAIHAHGPYSARVLRIYDLNGDLLYQLWHDGDLHPPLWMPGRRMLLLGGRNQRARWHERGQGEYRSYPLILFAVRPAVGRISNSWVSPTATGADETLVWYQCFLPAAGSDRFQDPSLLPPMPGDDPAGVLRFRLRLGRNPQATVSWLVDDRGNIMPETWIADDTYNPERAQDNPAPDPAIFRLGSLPAIALPQTPEPP